MVIGGKCTWMPLPVTDTKDLVIQRFNTKENLNIFLEKKMKDGKKKKILLVTRE